MSKRILVVDDDAMNLRMAEMFLKKGNYEVEKAVSGEECLAFLQVAMVDLVLLDVEMPGMNGIETLEEIRKREGLEKIPVMFLSASEEIGEKVEDGVYAVQGFIKKPFLPPNLLSEVERVIG